MSPLPDKRLPLLRRAVLLLALLAPAAPVAAGAQRVLGPSDDATVLPRGSVRLGGQSTWMRANERFATGLAGTPRGVAERLAHDYDVDSLGPSRLEGLRTVEAALRTLTGKSAVPSSLGRLRVDFDQSTVRVPFALEYGVTRRLMVGATIPFVQTYNEVSLLPNPARAEGTMGVNPAWAFAGARAQNFLAFSQVGEAVTRLQQQLAACAGSSAPACAAINADRGAAAAVAALGAAMAGAIGQVYGTREGQGSRYAPVEGSAIQKDVLARLAALSRDFERLLGLPAGRAGWIVARQIGAPLMGLADFRAIVGDSAYGIRGTLEPAARQGIGDVEFAAKFLLFDGWGAQIPQRIEPRGVALRVAIGAAYRLGTGTPDAAGDFTDVGTGDGQDDVEGRLFVDVLVGRRFWTSFVARYGIQQADVPILRIPAMPQDPFPAAYREQVVARDLGDYLVAEVSPRLTLTDALMASATLSVMRKGKDRHSGRFQAIDLAGAPITLDASALDAGTDRTEQRLVAGLSYSTMSAWYRGRSRLPVEVSYLAGQSLRGVGVPKGFFQSLGLRYYVRLFGSAESAPLRPTRPAAGR